MEEAFGHDPFEFDEHGVCRLEAAYAGYACLTLETWRRHSTDHDGEDRSYFAAFRCNRDAIVETLNDPESIWKMRNESGHVLYFTRVCDLKRQTPAGCIVPFKLPLVVIVNGNNLRIETFYPKRRVRHFGEVVYP